MLYCFWECLTLGREGEREEGREEGREGRALAAFTPAQALALDLALTLGLLRQYITQDSLCVVNHSIPCSALHAIDESALCTG